MEKKEVITSHDIFSSKQAKLSPHMKFFFAIMKRKMIIMEKKVSFSPRLKHYLQMKIMLPAGSQVYFDLVHS
jgi:hypothetical protein